MANIFKIAPDEIQSLIDPMGACYATDYITVEGFPIGDIDCESPYNEVDSGGRFFSGEESQEYGDRSQNIEIYDANTIANYDPAIIPYLEAPDGSGFERVEGAYDYQPIDDEEMGGI